MTNICPVKVIIVMGVSGSGKSTIGKLLARQLGWNFADADDYHSPENVEKMKQGVPLTDEDRRPWLAALSEEIRKWLKNDLGNVLACSALKESYRQELQRHDQEAVRLVYLAGSLALFKERMQQRKDHFMKADMLTSQFNALEDPKSALHVDASKTPEQIVADIRQAFSC